MNTSKAEVIATAVKWHHRLGHDYIVYMSPTGWQYCRRDLFWQYKSTRLAQSYGLVFVPEASA